MALRSKASTARIDLACRYYTDALHAHVDIMGHLRRGHDRSALRFVRPMIESSLRSLYTIHVSSDRDITRNSFPSSLGKMAERIEIRATYFSPMFTHQLLKRSDANGYTVDRLVNGWAHGDLTIIKPYCKPGSLEQCCAFWTAKNFLAFAQAACFALDPTLTPESPYSKKYY